MVKYGGNEYFYKKFLEGKDIFIKILCGKCGGKGYFVYTYLEWRSVVGLVPMIGLLASVTLVNFSQKDIVRSLTI